MALTGAKLDSDSGGFVSNCFPVRGLIKRDLNEGDGAWLVAHRAEQRRRFKAVLCAKPRTYSRIREERKRAEEQGIRLTEQQFDQLPDGEHEEERPVLDGYYLMKHCCVDDPADLCSVNIAGQELTDVKEEDLEMFDNVAYVNACENYLPFEVFRGFPSLRELEIPLNGLRNLRIINGDFPSLEVLDLSYNNLSQNDVLTLGQLPKLRVLHLTGNNFHNMPQDMAAPYFSGERKVRRQRFARLEVLLLDDNKLSDVTVFAALAGLHKLRHINMEKNEIELIPQLNCIEGRVVMHGRSEPKCHPKSGHKSGRHSKSQLSEAEEFVEPSKKLELKDGLDEKLLGKTNATDAGTQHGDVTGIHMENGESTLMPAEEETKKKDMSLEALLTDDFSLGDLSARINEFEAEAEAVIFKQNGENVTRKPEEEEYVPQIFPPFPELRYLNLAHNRISEEDALLAVAAWPMLVHLIIHNNPLTTQHSGDPPLLKRFLSDRLGIRLQRRDEPRIVKPHIEIPTGKSRKVSDRVPKVPRSTVEERLQQLALEAPNPPLALPAEPSRSWLAEDRTLSNLDLETSKRMPLPPIPPTPPSIRSPNIQAWAEKTKADRADKKVEGDLSQEEREKTSDSEAFFMTQVDQQEEERKQDKPNTQTEASMADDHNSGEDRYHGYELLLDLDPDDDMDAELPKDIQGNIRALKHTLGHTLVYRDPTVDLDRVKRVVPEFRRVPMPPPKPHKSHQERVDDILHTLRTCTMVDEESLGNILKDRAHLGKKFPEAQHLLGQIQRRYNTVRVSSMKEAHEARKIIDQAFEVLSKPKQMYKPSA